MKLSALPEHIGPYRVTGVLGRGGMGEVLAGHDDRLDRPVALKRIRAGARDPEKARQRLRREARAVARLSHPAIVGVYDWVEAAGEDWLVLERVDGRTLDQLLGAGPLPPERAVALARGVASGLAAAHGAGLVHRDLKASNVMVTKSGEVKILDFGIAKAVEAGRVELLTTLTGEGQVVGTVAAMSPEQALGQPVDHRSDLFSLGTLVYEMVSGISPFEGDTSVETLTRICTAKEQPLRRLVPEVPEDLSLLVGQLLEKEPARRPADAQQVVAALDRLASAPKAGSEAGPVDLTTLPQGVPRPLENAARAAPEGPPVPGRTYRRPLLVAAAVGLAVAALVALQPGVRDQLAQWLAGSEPQLGTYALYQRGMSALERYDKKGHIDAAIADFQRALAQDESHAPALAGLAWAYWLDFHVGSLDRQRLEQALGAARQAVALDEYLANARVSLGMVYLELGRGEEAERELEVALQLEPLNADARFGLSRLYDSQGRTSEAEEQIQQTVAARTAGWHHLASLGALHLKTGDYRKAEAAFRHSLELAPDNFLSFRNLGVALYMQGELAEAASEFQKALKIQPDATLYTNLGTVYFAQGLYPQAVSAFEKAIETGAGANNYLSWGNLADAYRWTPDNERRAEEAFLRAIQLLRVRLDAAPQDLSLRTQLALNLAKYGDCDQAVTEIAALTDLPGKGARAWYRLAVASEICRRRETALAALEMALQAGFSVTELQADPELLELRQDVRYHRLVASANLER